MVCTAHGATSGRASLIVLVVLAAGWASQVRGEDPASGRCGQILTDGVMQQLRVTMGEQKASTFHSKMCSEDQKEQAEASGGGAGISYAGIGLSFSQNESSREAYRKSMCSDEASGDDFSKLYNYAKVEASPAIVAAWRDCIALSKESVIPTIRRLDQDSGLYIGLSVSKASVDVVRYEADPGQVTCVGALAAATPEKPLALSNKERDLVCRRVPGYTGGFGVIIVTDAGPIGASVGPLQPVSLESKEAAALGDALARTELRAAPFGTIAAFAGRTVPDGWLLADGSDRSSDDCTALSAALGESFTRKELQGTGRFQLPDLRGEFVRGFTAGREGVDAGRVFGTSQDDLFEAHTHTVPIERFSMQDDKDEKEWYYGGGKAETGSAGGSETRPRNVALNYIVRADCK